MAVNYFKMQDFLPVNIFKPTYIVQCTYAFHDLFEMALIRGDGEIFQRFSFAWISKSIPKVYLIFTPTLPAILENLRTKVFQKVFKIFAQTLHSIFQNLRKAFLK